MLIDACFVAGEPQYRRISGVLVGQHVRVLALSKE